jgi:hypothetical protein
MPSSRSHSQPSSQSKLPSIRSQSQPLSQFHLPVASLRREMLCCRRSPEGQGAQLPIHDDEDVAEQHGLDGSGAGTRWSRHRTAWEQVYVYGVGAAVRMRVRGWKRECLPAHAPRRPAPGRARVAWHFACLDLRARDWSRRHQVAVCCMGATECMGGTPRVCVSEQRPPVHPASQPGSQPGRERVCRVLCASPCRPSGRESLGRGCSFSSCGACRRKKV